jgi:hypothetical protein
MKKINLGYSLAIIAMLCIGSYIFLKSEGVSAGGLIVIACFLGGCLLSDLRRK